MSNPARRIQALQYALADRMHCTVTALRISGDLVTVTFQSHGPASYIGPFERLLTRREVALALRSWRRRHEPVTCDGCGREIEEDDGCRELRDPQTEAVTARLHRDQRCLDLLRDEARWGDCL